jgi:hypothetical protein
MIDLEKIKFLAQKYHPEEIARLLNINVSTLRYQLKKHNISTPNGRTALTEELEQQIIALAAKGLYGTQIAKELGIPQQTIRYFLTTRKINVSSGLGICKISIENQISIKKLASEGFTGTAIGKKLGISKGAAFSFCKKNDIQLNSGPAPYTGLKPKTLHKLEIIRSLNKSGVTISKTAEDLGIGVHTVKGALKHMDIPWQKAYNGKFTKEELDSMLNPGFEFTGIKESGFYEVRCKTHTDFMIFRPATALPQGCPTCNNNGTSKAQQDIANWLISLNIKLVQGFKLGRKQIDIYVPELKLGIEYNGLYWHNENSPEPRLRQYHREKMKLANEQGIRLITIFEDEWLARTEQVKNFLASAVHSRKKSIFGRKCTVDSIKLDIAKQFLDENHIQGSTGSSFVSFGLIYKEELLGVITGGRHLRGGSRHLVLDRLCFRNGVHIAGGASKLFSSLRDYAIKNGYTSVISWSDNRWSEGNVYKQLGFELDAELGPDYSYTKNGISHKRFGKQSKQKKALLKEGGVGETESQMARSLGYSKIWDCGKKRWKMNLIPNPQQIR